MNDQEYTLLKSKMLRLTRIDLDSYKTQQMRRRLEGFIGRSQSAGVVPYCKLVERDPEALTKLKDFLTINVSEFFRDRPQFEVLSHKVLPHLLERNANLSIWSAGCSIGAEPYSISLLLEEIAPRGKHSILATDLDQTILSKGRAGGPYTSADVKNVEKRLLNKYFTADEIDSQAVYWAGAAIKRRVVFRQHNLLNDAFSNGFDLVVCRNVVIYFSGEAKTRLNRQFHRSLKNEGILFIGGTEALLEAKELGFQRLDGSFYQKRDLSPRRSTSEGAGMLPAKAA